jgi:anti-sigma factor ChrR (cupin superfamily)
MSHAFSPEDLELLDRLAAESLDPVEPPPAVRNLVMQGIRNVPGPHESRTIRADEGKWVTIAPGARTKKLTKEGRRVTFLLELDAHAVLPAHDHEGGENSYVVRGSCHIGGLSLTAGDFHHADGTAHHGDVVASAQGCLLLVTAEMAEAA